MNNVGTRLFLKLSMKAVNTIATHLYGSFNDVLKSSQNHMCVIQPTLHICRLHIVSRMCWWVSKIPTQTEPAYKYRPPQCWRNWVGEILNWNVHIAQSISLYASCFYMSLKLSKKFIHKSYGHLTWFRISIEYLPIQFWS